MRRILSILALLSGCAAVPPPEPTREAMNPTAAEPAPRPTILTVEYGNRSTKASLQLDLSANDVQVEMRGSPQKPETPAAAEPAAPSARSAPIPPTAIPAPSAAPAVPVQSAASFEDSIAARARRLVDSASRSSKVASDSVTTKVVAYLRKAQTAFYQGKFVDASEMARRSIELRPTAEGHALAGSISWVRKDREDARLHWMRARDLDPAYPGLAAMLDTLKAREVAR